MEWNERIDNHAILSTVYLCWRDSRWNSNICLAASHASSLAWRYSCRQNSPLEDVPMMMGDGEDYNEEGLCLDESNEQQRLRTSVLPLI